MKEIILAIAVLIGRGTPSNEVVSAIAGAVETPEEAALMTLYAALESSYKQDAVGDGGRSCGIWQQQCTRIAGFDLQERARIWLYDVRQFGLASVDSSAKRAAKRQKRAYDLLSRVDLPQE